MYYLILKKDKRNSVDIVNVIAKGLKQPIEEGCRNVGERRYMQK